MTCVIRDPFRFLVIPLIECPEAETRQDTSSVGPTQNYPGHLRMTMLFPGLEKQAANVRATTFSFCPGVANPIRDPFLCRWEVCRLEEGVMTSRVQWASELYCENMAVDKFRLPRENFQARVAMLTNRFP